MLCWQWLQKTKIRNSKWKCKQSKSASLMLTKCVLLWCFVLHKMPRGLSLSLSLSFSLSLSLSYLFLSLLSLSPISLSYLSLNLSLTLVLYLFLSLLANTQLKVDTTNTILKLNISSYHALMTCVSRQV
jgi:hypothetical protein